MSTKYEIIFLNQRKDMTMLEKDINEIIENQTEVIDALKEADHFYICHYCKKREQIEHRNLKFGKPKTVN